MPHFSERKGDLNPIVAQWRETISNKGSQCLMQVDKLRVMAWEKNKEIFIIIIKKTKKKESLINKKTNPKLATRGFNLHLLILKLLLDCLQVTFSPETLLDHS